MESYGITAIQNKPSLLKKMDVSKIVDIRAHKNIGYFISAKYESYIKDVIEKIEKDQKIEKLQKLKKHQDLEFCEVGLDDGIE